jgi:hypothetical protein
MMKTKISKAKKKPMTLDDFAIVIQRDLARMATKDDLKGLATKQDLQDLRAEVKKDLERFATKEELATSFSTLGDRISVAKDELQEQIAGLRYAKEIDDLRARVNLLEHKVGIRPSRRAA